MEDQIILFDKEIESKQTNTKIRVVMISGITFLSITILAIVYLFTLYFNSKASLTELQSQVKQLKDDTELFKISKTNDTDINKRIESISFDTYINRLQHQIEGGVVTDDFVVEKITIASLAPLKEGGTALLDSVIDLSVQPGSNSKYLGQSKFGITDRELKAKIQDVLDKIEPLYNRGVNILYKDHGYLTWDKGSHHVTVKNYDIGTYENGKFTLKGE